MVSSYKIIDNFEKQVYFTKAPALKEIAFLYSGNIFKYSMHSYLKQDFRNIFRRLFF